jgi:heme exporter protein C
MTGEGAGHRFAGPTSSRATRRLGAVALVGILLLLVFALAISPEDSRLSENGNRIGQFDAVRLFYVHVPMAFLSYASFVLTGVASVMHLRRRSRWWDTVAHAAAEVGVLFCGLTLVTGSIWGRPVWNTWWEWGDVRLMTTLILFLVYLGYLAFRRLPAEPTVRARRAAWLAITGLVLLPVVNRSVEWWEDRTLHQSSSTLGELQVDGLKVFTLILGMVVFALVELWLLAHRFRLGWLEDELDRAGLAVAIAERRAEAGVAGVAS